MDVLEKLAALRAMMRQQGLDAYIVPGTDPHASEYMASHWMETTWLSGFKGESGTILVTLDTALLWTDSRYYLQANKELEGSSIGLMRESDIDCPSISEWLCTHLSENQSVGVNPEMWSVDDYAALKTQLSKSVLTLKSIDLIGPLWTDGRPAIPTTPMYVYEEKYAGESVCKKIIRIRQKMAQMRAQAMIVSALDEIVWLLNIRGSDVEYNPVVISYLVLEQDTCTLFVDPCKIDNETKWYLQSQHIQTRPYEQVFEYIKGLRGAILFDGKKVNEALFEAIDNQCDKINAQSPILVDKSHKNAIELSGEREAMRQDAAALTRFFKWLEEEAFCQEQLPTEWDLMEKLHRYRAMGKNFIEESFGTIAGYQGNGAIVHYAATPQACAKVRPEGMLLLDSGGQYLEGTTDITRTVWLGGTIPEQAKRDYTYVLKGHIALQTIQFPRGTRGNQLDALAKQYMWAAGITFGHGTGHGVGHFLGCHEGPQNVRTDNNPTPLEVGQIISDEPGIYRTDLWGIRTENLITVVPAARQEAAVTNDEFLKFETLTLFYYDTSLIDYSLMTPEEIRWMNMYHERVYAETKPLLTPEEAEWLKNKCKPISL